MQNGRVTSVDEQTRPNGPLAARLILLFPDVPADTMLAILAAARGDLAAESNREADNAAPGSGTAAPGPGTAAPGPGIAGLGDALAAGLAAQAQEEDLRDSLAALSQLAMGQRGLEDMLTNIAQFAVQAIPGADGAGLTLFQDDRPDTVVATAPFVREVDSIQYDLGEGPCITAARERRTVHSGFLGGDPAFPQFGPQARDLGVDSVLSLPLLGWTGALGSMNVYAHARDAFDEHAAHLGELFAGPASISVQNAQTLAEAQRVAAQLQQALSTATGNVAAALAILARQRSITDA